MRPGCRGGGRKEWGAVLSAGGTIAVRIARCACTAAGGPGARHRYRRRAGGSIGKAAEAAGAMRAEPRPREGGSGRRGALLVTAAWARDQLP